MFEQSVQNFIASGLAGSPPFPAVGLIIAHIIFGILFLAAGIFLTIKLIIELKIYNIVKRFPGITVVVGQSNCGKSTLLNYAFRSYNTLDLCELLTQSKRGESKCAGNTGLIYHIRDRTS